MPFTKRLTTKIQYEFKDANWYEASAEIEKLAEQFPAHYIDIKIEIKRVREDKEATGVLKVMQPDLFGDDEDMVFRRAIDELDRQERELNAIRAKKSEQNNNDTITV